MEPRSRSAATTKYHKDWQRKTNKHFHSSADIDSLPPRSVDKHNHGGTNRRFLHDRKPDRRFSRNDSRQGPDNRHSLPNAQYTSSDYNNTAQVLRHDSDLQQPYSEHRISGNSLQLTTKEAFTDAPDGGSAGSIQTRLSQFAYSGCTQKTVDNE